MRTWIIGGSLLGLGLVVVLMLGLRSEATAKTMVVYKSPTCGCCAKWVEHMEAAGYEVEVHDMADVTPIKTEHGVAPELSSCHTAIVDDYVIEGHVPAKYVDQLLEEQPLVRGLAVPGMPMGSPGMEGAYKDAYDVVAFDAEGRAMVYGSEAGSR